MATGEVLFQGQCAWERSRALSGLDPAQMGRCETSPSDLPPPFYVEVSVASAGRWSRGGQASDSLSEKRQSS